MSRQLIYDRDEARRVCEEVMGHSLGDWEPAGFGNYPRATCSDCQAAVLVVNFAYGTAMDETCAEVRARREATA